jgi:hypothetical protein
VNIRVRALLALFLSTFVFSSCKDLTTPIDSRQYSTPRISFVAPVQDTIDTYKLPGGSGLPSDNVVVRITVSVKASDSLGISGVAGRVLSPTWTLTNQPSKVLQNFSLTDDGQNGDAVAGDGVFTGQTSFEILRYEIGTYHFQLQAFNVQGTASQSLTIPFYLINSNNHAPHIDSLAAAPDTLKLVDTAISVGALMAKVSDAEGRLDLLSVTAQATKPDGTQANTLVYLFDDGDASHADQVAGDNIYSSGIKLDPHASPPPQKGKYVFHFVATDKSGAVGQDSLIVVVQ